VAGVARIDNLAYPVFEGQAVREGDVDAFTLMRHPKSKRAYAWSEGKGDNERFFVVLQIPPVESPLDAVRASIAAETKKAKF
jgi:hypothetical protein